MKKHVIVLMLMLLLTFVFAGCGAKEEENAVGNEETVELKSTLTTLAKYDSFEFTEAELEPTEEELAYQENVKYSKILKDLDKTVAEDGDIVNIDYKGLLDGVAFEGGTAEGYSLMLGSGTFIDGFEEQLVGAEVGGSYELKLTFPADYQAADLAGKDVVFEVKVNKIQELVEPDEEYINGLMRDSKMKQLIVVKLIEGSKFKMDKKEIQEYYDAAMDQYLYYASAGGGLEAYLEFMGQTKKEFEDSVMKNVTDNVKSILVLDEIARREGLASEEEIAAGMLNDGTLLDEAVLNFLQERTVVK